MKRKKWPLFLLVCLALTLPAYAFDSMGTLVRNGASCELVSDASGDGWSVNDGANDLTLDNCKAESLQLYVQSSDIDIILMEGSVNEIDSFRYDINFEIYSALNLIIRGNGTLNVRSLEATMFGNPWESPLMFITVKDGASLKVDDGTQAQTYRDHRGMYWYSQFLDVPNYGYYSDAVEWAVQKGVTKGVSDCYFAPAATCTRGQVATFLWRAGGCPEPETAVNPFTDVKPSSAFYKAILWAAENGITEGTSKTTFSPGNPCTRAHVVTFLWRSRGRPAVTDAPSLADSFPQGYYTDAVRWADDAGLLGLTGEAFTPSAPCPRADIVTYLYRALNPR